MKLHKLILNVFAGRFPFFLMTALFSYACFLIIISLIPASQGPFGSFVSDFKLRCFNYDPYAGPFPWKYAIQMIFEPLMVLSLIMMFWWRRLKDWIRSPMRLIVPAVLGACVPVWVAVGLISIGSSLPPVPDLKQFPAEAMRVSLDARDFELIDQEGEAVQLSDLKGKAVFLTAVYTRCNATCPMIFTKMKETMDALPEEIRDNVEFVALTLDPAFDTQEIRSRVTELYQFNRDIFHFLGGDEEYMLDILDDFQFARDHVEYMDQINHANLFVLIDKQGNIAYRFALSSPNPEWMRKALELLAVEDPAPA